MRILHVESGRNLYGGPRQVLLLIEGLAAAGVENLLACPRGSAIARAARDARVVELPMRGDFDIALIFRLRRLIDQTHPDLIHLHSRRGADWLGALAAHNRVPVVLSRRVDNPEAHLVAKPRYALADRVIAISQRIREVLLETGVADEKIVCVRSAVPPATIQSRDRVWFADTFGISADQPAVGVIAQLIPRKGHRYLIDALPELVRTHPGLRVLLFGRGPAERELRQQVGALGLDPVVSFAGFRSDLDRVLPNLELVVHPALREGLGIAVLQAAQAGLPIVACRAGGIPEVIIDGETGLLVTPADSAALIDAVQSLLDDRQRARRLGEAGARHVAAHFGVEQMVEGNLAVYRELL